MTRTGDADLPDKAREAASSAEDGAEAVAEHPAFEAVARVGHVMNGLVHLMIGWIALRLALGDSGGEADQAGALQTFSEAPGGSILLGIGGIAMIALALWQLAEAWFGARRESSGGSAAKEAVKGIGKAVVYLALAATALRFALGGSSDSGQQSQEATATIMSNPGGRIAVVVLGLVVVVIGGYHVVKGATRSFVEDLESTGGRTVGRAMIVSGAIGFVAKGIALVAVGGLFGWAGIGADPEKATGLDGALKTMAGLPAGGVLLGFVGAGLVLYGVYCFFLARYADM